MRGVTCCPLSDKFELVNSFLDVGNGISSCIENNNIVNYNILVEPDVSTPLLCSVFMKRSQRCQMAAARRKESVLSYSEVIEQLYTLVRRVTGAVGGGVDMQALLSSHAL